MLSDNQILKGCTLKIAVGITVLTILLLAGGAGAENAIWDEASGSTLPFTWNFTNFDSFNVSGTGTEDLTILQQTLGSGQRTILKTNLMYTTTAQPVPLKVATALNLVGNNAGLTLIGLEMASSGRAFDNGKYDILNWQAEKYVALNGKVDKLTKLVMEQGITEKKTLVIGETWNVGGGWMLTANSIDARATPRQVWLTLSKDGVKKDDKVISAGTPDARPIYTYVEKSLAGETDVPVFVTYVDSVFAGANSDIVQIRYTWAIDEAVTQIRGVDTYGVFDNANVAWKTLSMSNTNKTITLSPDATINLMGNIKFKVDKNTTSLKFYPAIEPKLNITASQTGVPSGTSTNLLFTVTSNGSPISGVTVTLSGAATGSGLTNASGQVTINIMASYIGTIIAYAGKAGYARGTTSIKAAYSSPLPAMASWNLQENYALNLIDIDAKAYPRQARFQLLKNNGVVDDAILYAGQIYYYNSSDSTIFTAKVDSIFSGTQGKLVKLVNASQYPESGGGNLSINASHLFKSGIFTGIDWKLNENYNLRMMDIDGYSYPRQVYFELLKNDVVKDEVVLSQGQTYLYNNSTNSRVLESTIDFIFNGTQGNLVKLIYVTQYSESNNQTLFSNKVHFYKSANFTGVPWQLKEGYELRMMDMDVKATPRQVWLELLKNDIEIYETILYSGQKYYYYNSSGSAILTVKVDEIFKGETAGIVILKEVSQYSEADDSILLNNVTNSFVIGNISRADQVLYDGYTISLLGTDVNSYPRLAWLRLYKNNNPVDEKIASAGDIWNYSLSGKPVLYAEVDAIFSGATSNLAKLKNVTQYSELNSSLLISGAIYTIGTNISSPGSGGGGGGGSGGGGTSGENFSKTHEIRGAVWNDTSTTTFTNNWTPQNFAGFFYDSEDNLGAEILIIDQFDLAGSMNSNNMPETRTIAKNNLKYTTTAQGRTLKVAEALNLSGNNSGLTARGLEQAAQVDMHTARNLAARIRRQFQGRKFCDSTALIREDRDR